MDPDPTSITQVSVSILKSLKNILNNQKYISFGLGKFNILRQISIFNLFLHVKNLKKWERNQDLDLFFVIRIFDILYCMHLSDRIRNPGLHNIPVRGISWLDIY